MWSIFTINETNTDLILEKLDLVKKTIFQTYEVEVKKYFAKKLVVYFDNAMILQKENGLHINLMESLSKSEKEMRDTRQIFPDIELYWFKESIEHSFLIKNLKEEHFELLEKLGFEFIHKTTSLPNDQKKLEFESFKTLLFSIAFVNYAKDWLEFSPSLEERSKLQASFVYLDMKIKKDNLDLYEQIKLEKTLEDNKVYQDLYNKIHRLMPKIEQSLEKEWKYGLFDGIKEQTVDNALNQLNNKVEEAKRVKLKS